jgi:glycosyltransferase involved in cell wall biosynthesis
MRRLPTIGSAHGGCVEAIRHLKTGFIVDPRESTILADFASQLLLSAETRRALGETGHKWVREEFKWEDRAAALHSHYHAASEFLKDA